MTIVASGITPTIVPREADGDGSVDSVPVADTSSRLPPLRWIAEEALVYDAERNELHRPDCSAATARAYELPGGRALRLVWAPRLCSDCRPDATMGLG